MNFFKKKKKPEWSGPLGCSVNSEWWKKCVALFKKDTGQECDPEKDAQKIYEHWLKSYLSK